MSAMTADCFNLASLEAFTTQLVAAGFEPIEDYGRKYWTGAIYPAFAPLTDATTMDIHIAPGWPFRPPALFVAGLNTNHSTLDGLVCMWREGDTSLRWLTVEGPLRSDRGMVPEREARLGTRRTSGMTLF